MDRIRLRRCGDGVEGRSERNGALVLDLSLFRLLRLRWKSDGDELSRVGDGDEPGSVGWKVWCERTERSLDGVRDRVVCRAVDELGLMIVLTR